MNSSAPEPEGHGRAATPFRLFIITGEASGDQLAAAFVQALRRRLAPRPVEISGVGGAALQALGLTPLFPQTDIQHIGILAVLRSLFTILARVGEAAEAVEEMRPDLLLTVDVPDFSLRVARKVRRAAPGVPIIHWVAPTVWAWRPGRAKAMKPYVDRVLALLPFEPDAFEKLGGPRTIYVGHTLLDEVDSIRPDADEQRIRDNVAAPVILVLPGSRRSEIWLLLPSYREAVRLIAARHPHARFVLPAVPHLAAAIGEEVAGWPVPVEVLHGEEAKRAAFRRARVALAASGTVTLELALAGVPLIGAYRGHPIEAYIARRLIRTRTILLCNIVLGENIVPELLQDEATGPALAAAVMDLIGETPGRSAQLVAFRRIDGMMALANGKSSADAAVDAALELLVERGALV